MSTDNRGGWDIQNMYHRIHSNQWTDMMNFTDAYVVGGQGSGLATVLSNVSKFIKSSGTSATLPVYTNTVASNGIRNKTYGWFIVGNVSLSTPSPATPAPNSSTRRMSFSNDSWTTIPATYSSRNYASAFNLSYGWSIGGQSGPGAYISTSGKFSLSNESWSAGLASGIPTTLNSGVFNYNESYISISSTSSITKYIFSPDSVGVIPAKISASRTNANGTMFSIKGVGHFFAGDIVSTIDKITYTNESTSVIPAKLPVAATKARGHSDALGCYIIGGQSATSPGVTPISNISFLNYYSDFLYNFNPGYYTSNHVSF